MSATKTAIDIALDKKAENARELGLDYEPAPVAEPRKQETVAWGVDWGKAGDIPCVSIIKRLPGGGIEVVAVEYGPTLPSWIEVQQVKWEGDKLLAKLKEKNRG